MCDGGDGGGGGASHGGEEGNQSGGNVGGGSGGNVGPGYGGGSGGLPTTRSDPPSFGTGNAPAPGAPTGGSGFYGGWESASSNVDPAMTNMSSETGAFGFDSTTGAKYGSLAGILGGLPGMMIGSLIGGLMGQATGGNVDAYGGGDPEAGGGPGDPAGYVPHSVPGWTPPGDQSIGTLMGGGGGSSSTSYDAPASTTRGFGLSTTPDKSNVSKMFGKKRDDRLLSTLVFGEDEFTKNIF